VDHTDAATDQEHINTVILSDTGIPDRTEAILSGNTAPAEDALISAAKKLEAAGAEIIAMPCNTAHYFINDIRAAVSCEVIDMIEAAVADAVKKSGKADPAIGVLATDGTLEAGVYEKEISKQSAHFERPDAMGQREIMSLIYDDIKSGREADEIKFNAAVRSFSEDCDIVILACTELSVYKESHDVPSNCIDAMDSLVRETILACGATYRE
jgi:aspartate racemase